MKLDLDVAYNSNATRTLTLIKKQSARSSVVFKQRVLFHYNWLGNESTIFTFLLSKYRRISKVNIMTKVFTMFFNSRIFQIITHRIFMFPNPSRKLPSSLSDVNLITIISSTWESIYSSKNILRKAQLL